MAFTMKEKYARIETDKLPKEYLSELDEMKKDTGNFNDQDAIDIMEENFNILYNLIEKNYPDALKKGTKKVATKKPATKKVVKKKAKKLKEADIDIIEDKLLNDESSTDEEMIAYFQSEIGLNENQAKRWVKKRNDYLKKAGDPYKTAKYKVRTKAKKELRKDKNIIKTMDGVKIDRTDPALKGKVFYDENGKKYKCVGYKKKLEECVLKDDDGKEIVSCLKDMYIEDPTKKKSGDDMITECRTVLKDAGYRVVKQKAGTKVVKRKKIRPDRAIIKERVDETFTPVLKDISGSKEKEKEFADTIKMIESIKTKLGKLINLLNNLAEDNDYNKIKKLDKLLSELIPDDKK